MRRWNWGVVPILIVLMLVWNELWQSMRFPRPVGVQQTGTMPAAEAAATNAGPARGTEAENVAEDPGLMLRQIVKDLSGGNAGAREAAQRKLALVGYRQRELLARLAADAGDAGVKKALTDRLQALEAQVATNPPPVTLQVKGVPLGDLADALNADMGTHIKALSPPMTMPSLYTVDATERPFWEIFAALNSQHPLGLAPSTDFALREMQPMAGRIDRMAVSGHFMMSAAITKNTTAVNLVDLARYNFVYSLAADPRMHPIEVTPDLIFGPDSAGNRTPGGAGGTAAAGARRIAGPSVSLAATFLASPAAGTTLTQVRLEAHFVLAVSLKSMDAEGIEAKEGQDVTFGGATVTIKRFRKGNSGVVVEMTSKAADDASRRATFRLTDARGLTRWTGTPGSGANLTMADYAAPYRLHIEAPDKILETDASFEIKDVALPQ